MDASNNIPTSNPEPTKISYRQIVTDDKGKGLVSRAESLIFILVSILSLDKELCTNVKIQKACYESLRILPGIAKCHL